MCRNRRDVHRVGEDGPLAGGPATSHLPCLQKPRSYHGQSLILDSGSMCRNGHSLLLHSPAGTRQGWVWGELDPDQPLILRRPGLQDSREGWGFRCPVGPASPETQGSVSRSLSHLACTWAGMVLPPQSVLPRGSQMLGYTSSNSSNSSRLNPSPRGGVLGIVGGVQMCKRTS